MSTGLAASSLISDLMSELACIKDVLVSTCVRQVPRRKSTHRVFLKPLLGRSRHHHRHRHFCHFCRQFLTTVTDRARAAHSRRTRTQHTQVHTHCVAETAPQATSRPRLTNQGNPGSTNLWHLQGHVLEPAPVSISPSPAHAHYVSITPLST